MAMFAIIKKSWQWILGGLIVTASASFLIPETPLGAAVPQVGDVIQGHQIIEHDKDARGFDIGNPRTLIKYAYIGGILDESVPNTASAEAHKKGLVIENEVSRNSRARTFSTNQTKTYVTDIVSGVPQYFKDDFGTWWQAEYAT